MVAVFLDEIVVTVIGEICRDVRTFKLGEGAYCVYLCEFRAHFL